MFSQNKLLRVTYMADIIKSRLKEFINTHKKGGIGVNIDNSEFIVDSNCNNFCVLDKENFRKDKINDFKINKNHQQLKKMFGDKNAEHLINVVLNANKLLIDNYVSFDDFFKKIDDMIIDVRDIINTKKYKNVEYDKCIFVIPTEKCLNKSEYYEKSNYWIMLYVLSQLTDAEYNEIKLYFPSYSKCTEIDIYINPLFIFCDDISYSGSQMLQNMHNLEHSVSVYVNKPNFYLIAYGTTECARNVLCNPFKLNGKMYLIDGKPFYQRNIINIDELINIKSSVSLLNEFCPDLTIAYYVQHDNNFCNNMFANIAFNYVKVNNKITLTTYFAKYPDYVSTEQICYIERNNALYSAHFNSMIDYGVKNEVYDEEWCRQFYEDTIVYGYKKYIEFVKNLYYFYSSCEGKRLLNVNKYSIAFDNMSIKYDEIITEAKKSTEIQNEIQSLKLETCEGLKNFHSSEEYTNSYMHHESIKKYTGVNEIFTSTMILDLVEFYENNRNIVMSYRIIKDRCHDYYKYYEKVEVDHNSNTIHVEIYLNNNKKYEGTKYINGIFVIMRGDAMYGAVNCDKKSSSVFLQFDDIYVNWSKEFIQDECSINCNNPKKYYCPTINKNKIDGALLKFNECNNHDPDDINDECYEKNNIISKRKYVTKLLKTTDYRHFSH